MRDNVSGAKRTDLPVVLCRVVAKRLRCHAMQNDLVPADRRMSGHAVRRAPGRRSAGLWCRRGGQWWWRWWWKMGGGCGCGCGVDEHEDEVEVESQTRPLDGEAHHHNHSFSPSKSPRTNRTSRQGYQDLIRQYWASHTLILPHLGLCWVPSSLHPSPNPGWITTRPSPPMGGCPGRGTVAPPSD